MNPEEVLYKFNVEFTRQEIIDLVEAEGDEPTQVNMDNMKNAIDDYFNNIDWDMIIFIYDQAKQNPEPPEPPAEQ